MAWEMQNSGASYNEIHQATRIFKNINGYDTFFSNTIYVGDLTYGGKLYEDFVPALIPREWFDAEQKRREERAKKFIGKPMNRNDEVYMPSYRNLDLRDSVSLTRHKLLFSVPIPASTATNNQYPDKYQLYANILNRREQGMSYREIGEELGIHWTRVSQILKRR